MEIQNQDLILLILQCVGERTSDANIAKLAGKSEKELLATLEGLQSKEEYIRDGIKRGIRGILNKIETDGYAATSSRPREPATLRPKLFSKYF